MYPKNYNQLDFISNPGNRYKTEYVGEIQDDGTIVLVEVGKTDLKELHNRDAESCDVNNIVQRFANGDISALQQVQGSYMDMLGMPSDLRGMHDMIKNLQNSFDLLPEEQRNQFASFEDWLGSVGSERFNKAMSVEKEKAVEPQPSGEASTVVSPA